VVDLQDSAGCTACDRRWFSHRARGEAERFATVVWVAGS
jgi:copper oxidase (laccase) domain-containing protein